NWMRERTCLGDGMRRRPIPGVAFVATTATLLSVGGASVPPAASIRLGDRADDERGLEDERFAGPRRVPADRLGDPLEPVADGVRVHEELSCGRLERPAVVEVGPEGTEQVGRLLAEGLVHAGD